MYEIILSFLTAFVIAYFAIPNIIAIARSKNLFDIPEERRSHKIPTPSLGGIAIFAGIVAAVTLWTPPNKFGNMQYILCSLFIMFMVGIKDDLTPIRATSKLLGQLFAAAVLVLLADVQITHFHGIFGFRALPAFFSVPFSLLVILVVINAFNLIDGINGLSGGLGTLICITFGTWFFLIGRTELAILSLAACGALLAFLRFNFTPAEIFMGDTGSLIMGTICSVLAISFMEAHQQLESQSYAFKAAPAIVLGILILPIFDTLRVFFLRLRQGRSPFSPDRNHIHHLLIDSGFSHMQATGILLCSALGFIFLVFFLRRMGALPLMLVVFSAAILLTGFLQWRVNVQKKRFRA